MKTLHLLLLVVSASLICFSSSLAQEKSKIMLPTSSSENAVKMYFKSIEAAENAELSISINFMNEALKEDPDFFMVHCQKALYALYAGDYDQLKQFAKNAVECRHNLNEAEQLLKDALIAVQKNPTANLTEAGKKLVEMYPRDKNSYYTLAIFQTKQGDYKGAAKTYKKGLKVTNNPAPFYNMLGYTYMSEGDMKKAEKAFNKYIKLNPNHPNPYDSKGDYFMEIKEYQMAYKSFMKAHEINPNWSYEKAEKAKKLLEEAAGISGSNTKL